MNEIRTKHRLTLHEVEPRKAVQNFLDVLNKRRASGVSNPRDMIYGHLGLADSSIQSHVPIDYDKSICQVFEDITNYYINTTKDLSILSLVEEISLGKRRTNIPSWVPDWTCSYIPGLSTHRSRLPGTKSVFSLVIPHVIAVPGWHLGTARLVMPCSSWSPDESRPNPNKEEGYLQMWLTRPECQEAQKIILDFHRTICEHLYEEICEVSIADVQSKIDHDLLLQLIAIVVESFADMELVKESEDALMFVKLANLFYSLLNAIAKSQHSGSTIAILDGMRIIQVPAMTQVGDVVCNLAQYEELTILRPEVVGLSGEAIAALKADFANKEVHSEEKGVAAKARLGSFKFVTYGPPVSEAVNRDIQKGIKGWNCITKAEIEESFQIFALH
ncbi:hypothetical protein B0J14DRAFT_557873 [Halenospora varia]|nr:hypothetical protein B0J14DRAFT_557873 [Halenospora varia]